MTFYSPLRYPGGKGKIAKYFKQIINENSLCGEVYVEPYAGGAGVAFSLLFDGYVSKIIINDIDRSIYAFWYSVLNKTEELCKLIKETPVTLKIWKMQKKIQKEKNRYGLLKLGFSTFFLNRTNRSGILRAGVIGGKHQSGKWKINMRYNKSDLINRIRRIALYKDCIEIYNLDAVKLVKYLRNKLSRRTLFYFDPPYYTKGKELYLDYYKDNDHKKIASEISKIKKQRWVVTYDNVQSIKDIYKNFRQMKYNLTYSAGKINKGEELMIFSDNLYVYKPPLII